ncbi:MAG: hypothetical protein JSW52_01395 [Candidatus Coatesbacteria bacterium]|nr:MAG: hypothetical protein JSW52_01395 [Candidatus Coatesbacteria bacterium]
MVEKESNSGLAKGDSGRVLRNYGRDCAKVKVAVQYAEDDQEMKMSQVFNNAGLNCDKKGDWDIFIACYKHIMGIYNDSMRGDPVFCNTDYLYWKKHINGIYKSIINNKRD